MNYPEILPTLPEIWAPVSTDKEFVFNFKEENLKIVPGTYEVVVSSKLLSRFQSQSYDLTYYIALEPDSTFG